MSQKNVRRLITAGALAMLLAANGSAWAGTRDAGRAHGVWQWFAHIWQTGLSALWTGSSTQNSGGGTIDQGYGVDPNG
jgi:hypothetical protein